MLIDDIITFNLDRVTYKMVSTGKFLPKTKILDIQCYGGWGRPFQLTIDFCISKIIALELICLPLRRDPTAIS